MIEAQLAVLVFALILDWFLGEPKILWDSLPHPVVLFGKAIRYFDKRLNLATKSDEIRYRQGSTAIAGLIVLAVMIGIFFHYILQKLGVFGWVLEGILVFFLLAQKSLIEHVMAVANGLRDEGLAGGRRSIAMIAGRDPNSLDRSAVCRTAIESLAENFSDGVVAPAFWYAIFGLPGIFAYKMINTADSMIGYRNEKYLHFGKTAAQIDDLANWLPARLSIGLIAVGALFAGGFGAARLALKTALQDAGLHRSPNSGWPEAAMAGAINIALGGPRIYPGEMVQQAYINAAGKHQLDIADIEKAVRVFSFACATLVAVAAILAALP